MLRLAVPAALLLATVAMAAHAARTSATAYVLARAADSAGLPLPAGDMPEPAAWASMVLGFGLAGAALRRRRRAAATV